LGKINFKLTRRSQHSQ